MKKQDVQPQPVAQAGRAREWGCWHCLNQTIQHERVYWAAYGQVEATGQW